jgi:hypothetical protein
MDRVRRAKADFILTGKPSYLRAIRLMARDPGAGAEIEKTQKLFPQWTAEVAFESLRDVVEFKPERVVDRIAPRALMWIHTDKDRLVP